MAQTHDTFDELVRGLFSDFAGPLAGNVVNGGWVPPTDIVEEEGRFVARIDLPGLGREDIKISVENETLTVKGERQRQAESKESGYRRFERSYGAFTRSFTIPNTIDAKRIEATYKDGVLTVVLPKSEESRPKMIDVKVN